MNTTTAETFNVKISGREFVAQGPTPRFGTYLLTGPRGATYLATQAYVGLPVLKVLGGRGMTELRIAGNAVRLVPTVDGLREATRADYAKAAAK